MNDLLLAFNLALSKTCISRSEVNIPKQSFTSAPKPSEVRVDKTNQGVNVIVSDSATLTASVYIQIAYKEEVDEQIIPQNFDLILKLKNINKNSLIREVSLQKALSAYKNAMDSFDDIVCFKQLYNSGEFATDWDGKVLTGDKFDNEFITLTNVSKSDIELWRKLYDRTKHSDRNPSDVKKYFEGIQQLPTMRINLRKACTLAIINRLNQI